MRCGSSISDWRTKHRGATLVYRLVLKLKFLHQYKHTDG